MRKKDKEVKVNKKYNHAKISKPIMKESQIHKGTIVMERNWNQNFYGMETVTKVKGANGELLCTIYSGGSGYQAYKIVPNEEHYDYYEDKWDEDFFD